MVSQTRAATAVLKQELDMLHEGDDNSVLGAASFCEEREDLWTYWFCTCQCSAFRTCVYMYM
jgi:hypothetical protein